ncbi:MAG TPA: DUF2961 domain-containing protein [Planctomycetota bacterium]|nr:DUF2961 domain-containing protein [Planctomycetota bacterium]HRR79693.1 DUF2961 domain-containing protein [Planctomycetota bacterium]HRT95918.1 DUF2961 domain-containing protein [Planctomycetota bacterium]
MGASSLDDLLRLRDGRSRRVSSTAKLPDGRPDPNSNADNVTVPPGRTHVLADLKGPGIVTHLWMTFLGPEPHPWAPDGAANHREMVLRVFWDGRKEPAVEAPVGDFFAAPFGQRMAVNSLPVAIEGGASYNCFWPMPFAKSARIEVENDGDKAIALLYHNVDWVQKESLPPDTPYFHAQYRQDYPLKEGGGDYLILETEGRGHYVGTVLGVRSRSPGWFGEGDEKIAIDDDAEPTVWGTGTEDYFLCAWGLRTCSFPYFGVPYTDGGHVLGGRTCAYRWHIADPIVFQKKIRVAIERMGWISVDENPKRESTSWNERQDDYSSVAFWYQLGEPRRFAKVPPCAERRLPEIDIVVHGRSFTDAKYHGAGGAIVQKGGWWTDYAQLLYQPPSAKDAWVEIPFEAKRREPRRLVLKLTTSYDFGIYEAYLDGVRIGERLDLYSSDIQVREFPLLDLWLDAGPHKLRLVCVGKRDVSTGYWLGLDSLRLRERRPRVERYGHDKEADWRKNLVLY